MRALFAHDHRFIPIDELMYSESQFEASMWDRYLRHFEELTIAARIGAIPNGKHLSQLELSSRENVHFALFRNITSFRGLVFERRSAKRRMVELVQSHDAVIARLPSEIGLLAIAAADATATPWAVEVVGCPWDGLWNYGTLSGRLYAPIAFARMRSAVTEAQHALYVTREFLQRRYPSPNAHNTANVSNVALPAMACDLAPRLSRIANHSAGHLTLGLIGTLHGRFKGIQTVLDALASMRERAAGLTLRILGGGDSAPWEAEVARRGLSQHVHFDGTLPAGESVMHWLDAVDIYVQPSLKEGLPRALIEAMSRGCPSIGSTTAGIPELLPAEDIFPAGDAGALRDLLSKRLTDRQWMAERARSNFERAKRYRPEVLEVRRDRFWRAFVSDHSKSHQS